MTAAAKTARGEAFETAARTAGARLEGELAAAAGDAGARTAAWRRYGDAQEAAGDAYREAMDADPDAGQVSTAEACALAREAGADAGRNAAAWCFDGNTPAAAYERVAAGIAEGDPLVLDELREPVLAGDYDTPDLYEDLGLEFDPAEEGEIALVTDAWRDAATAAFWAEVERIVHANIG